MAGWRKGMTRALSAVLAIVVFGAPALAQEVPEGVRYVPAPASTNAKAEDRLRAALASEPYQLAELGTTASPRLLVGPFLSGSLVASGAVKPREFVQGRYSVPLSDDVKPEMPGIGAETATQRAALDAALTRAIPRGAVTVRRMTPSEMALIWFYIGWDITEPVFAVEQGGRTLVADFDEAGESLTWLEDISQPCFRVVWEGGGLEGCFCSTTVHEGSRYQVVFERSAEVESCSPAGTPTGTP
jgi:hypothetical protein